MLPLFQVFRDEKVRKFARHQLCHLRVAILVIDIEGGELSILALRQFDVDVLAHRPYQFVGVLMLRVLGVETDIFNDAEKTGTAQDLLRNAVELMLNVDVDVRLNKFLRHRSTLDQNERARAVGHRNQPTRSPHQRPAAEKGHKKLPAPAADDSLDLGKIG